MTNSQHASGKLRQKRWLVNCNIIYTYKKQKVGGKEGKGKNMRREKLEGEEELFITH